MAADRITVAERFLTAMVSAGASPKGLASAAASLWRSCVAPSGSLSGDELSSRISAVTPILEAKISGTGASGTARAYRNLAEHEFDLGVPFSEVLPCHAQALQRGSRRRRRRHPAVETFNMASPRASPVPSCGQCAALGCTSIGPVSGSGSDDAENSLDGALTTKLPSDACYRHFAELLDSKFDFLIAKVEGLLEQQPHTSTFCAPRSDAAGGAIPFVHERAKAGPPRTLRMQVSDAADEGATDQGTPLQPSLATQRAATESPSTVVTFEDLEPNND